MIRPCSYCRTTRFGTRKLWKFICISGAPKCAAFGGAVIYAYKTNGKFKQWQTSNTQNDQLFHQSRCLAGLYLILALSQLHLECIIKCIIKCIIILYMKVSNGLIRENKSKCAHADFGWAVDLFQHWQVLSGAECLEPGIPYELRLKLRSRCVDISLLVILLL